MELAVLGDQLISFFIAVACVGKMKLTEVQRIQLFFIIGQCVLADQGDYSRVNSGLASVHASWRQ